MRQALARLQRVHAFWLGLQSGRMDMYGILLSARQLDNIRRVAWQFSRLRYPPDDAIETMLDAMLGAASPAIPWRDAIAIEYRVRERGFQLGVPGTFASLWRCSRAETRPGCLWDAGIAAAYAHQATMNLTAQEMEAMQAWLEADARDLESARKVYGQAVQDNMVQFEDAKTILRQLSFNYAGRILATVAIPASDWSMRIHDGEANRRMMWLQRQMLRQQIELNAVPDFLTAQDDALRNPYDGEPFGWDPRFRELWFVPRASKYWKRERFSLPYDPASREWVVACPQPALFDFYKLDEDDSGTDHEWSYQASCGNGDTASWGFVNPPEPAPGEPRSTPRWFSALRVWRHGDELSLRIAQEENEPVASREHTVPLQSDREMHLLYPTDANDRARFALKFIEGAPPMMISVRAVECPPANWPVPSPRWARYGCAICNASAMNASR